MLDIKIINGKIIDGTGDKAFPGDVGIIGERIAAVGDLRDKESREVIDAEGKLVCPGFIDMHSHSDLSIVYDHHANARIYNGVTTEVIGNCGIGVAPVNPDKRKLLVDYLGTRLIGSIPVQIELPWSSFGEYLEYVNSIKPCVNIAPLLAQGAIRISEMGFSNENPTEEEMDRMRKRVRESMEEGALGLTSGLVYLPGEYTTTDELIELSKELRDFGGYYTSHIRNEGEKVFESLEEAISIGKAAGVPVHISHLKLIGEKVSGNADKLLKRIDDAALEGVDVTFDVYPYTAGQTSLSALMPPWCFEGGVGKLVERLHDPALRVKIMQDIQTGIPGWQNFAKAAGDWNKVIIATMFNESSKWLEGKSIAEIAQLQQKDPFDAVFDLIIDEKGKIQIVVDLMKEEDVEKIISHKKAMIGSDSMCLSTEGILSSGKPHPRAFGTHARVISRYVNEKGLFTIEEAVNRMSHLPAERLGIRDRGLIKEDYFADIIVFDPDEVEDKATYTDPKQYSTGIDTVIINGQAVMLHGKRYEVFPGKVLKK